MSTKQQHKNGILQTGIQYIKNTLEPANQTQNIDQNKRNTLRKAGAATVGITALAGCADETTRDPEPTNNTTNNQDNEDEIKEEKPGLQLDFNKQQMWEKETEYYKNRSSRDINGTKPIDATPAKHLQNANLKNTTEFENALIKTLNTGIHTVAENVDHDSSSLTGGVAAAVNHKLQQELEENYDNFDAIMLSHGSSGHGYTLNFSTDHELTTADSNTDNVGPAKERPLQNRPDGNQLNDPIPQFNEEKLIGSDYDAQINRLRYQRFTNSGYRSHSRDEWSDKIRFDLEKLPSFYEEAILSEDGQLFMENVRPAIATLANMHEHNHFQDEEYVSVISTPSELPTLDEYDSLDAYAEELTENHIEVFDSADEYEEATMAPEGYQPE